MKSSNRFLFIGIALLRICHAAPVQPADTEYRHVGQPEYLAAKTNILWSLKSHNSDPHDREPHDQFLKRQVEDPDKVITPDLSRQEDPMGVDNPRPMGRKYPGRREKEKRQNEEPNRPVPDRLQKRQSEDADKVFDPDPDRYSKIVMPQEPWGHPFGSGFSPPPIRYPMADRTRRRQNEDPDKVHDKHKAHSVKQQGP